MLGVELRYLVLLMLTLWLQKISAIEGAKEDRVPFCPGNDLTLKCAVKAGIPRVWMYRGANEVQKLARVENKRVQYYPNLSRIFGLRASVKSNGSLVIRSTVGSDEGTYVCENEAHERVLYDLEFNCRGKVTHETLNVCTPTDTEGSVFVPCEARRRVKQNNTDWLVWNINQERLVYFDDGGLIWNVKFKGMARIIDTNTGTLALSTASEILTQWLGGGFEMNLTCYVSKLDAGTSERHRVRVKPIDCNYQVNTVIDNSSLTLSCPVVSHDAFAIPTRKAIWELELNHTSRRFASRLRGQVNVAQDVTGNVFVTPDFALAFKQHRDIAGNYCCQVTNLEGELVGQRYFVTVTVMQPLPSTSGGERLCDVIKLAWVTALVLVLLSL